MTATFAARFVRFGRCEADQEPYAPQCDEEAAELRALILATPTDQLEPITMNLDVALTVAATDLDRISWVAKADQIAQLQDMKRCADLLILAHERRTYDPTVEREY